jgi:hypothetical protein
MSDNYEQTAEEENRLKEIAAELENLCTECRALQKRRVQIDRRLGEHALESRWQSDRSVITKAIGENVRRRQELEAEERVIRARPFHRSNVARAKEQEAHARQIRIDRLKEAERDRLEAVQALRDESRELYTPRNKPKSNRAIKPETPAQKHYRLTYEALKEAGLLSESGKVKLDNQSLRAIKTALDDKRIGLPPGTDWCDEGDEKNWDNALLMSEANVKSYLSNIPARLKRK